MSASNRAKLRFVTFLTFVRFPLVLMFLGGAIVHSATGHRLPWLFALTFTALVSSAVTDLFDGYFARRFRVVTRFGAHADPLMDKFFYLASLPVLVFVAARNGNVGHSMVLLVLAILFLLRDQWVSFLRSIGSIYNVSGAAHWSGKLRTAINFPLICTIYYCEEAPVAIQFIPSALLGAFEALGLLATILSLYTYTRRYWPYVRRAADVRLTSSWDDPSPGCVPGDPSAAKAESLELMATGVAHDFNNLLAAILGNTGVILRRLQHGSPLKENAEEIRATAGTALELTDQIMSYAGKGNFTMEPIELSALVAEMKAEIGRTVSGNVAVEFSLAEGVPPVAADPARMRKVILNLVKNSSEAVVDRPGTVKVSVAATGAPGDGATRVLLEVSDNGRGMDADLKTRAFDPFFSTRIRGRGLGLSETAGLVRAQEGTIVVDSETGKGTTVRIELPASEPDRDGGPPGPVAG